MGILDLFGLSKNSRQTVEIADSVPDSEKKYYQDDSYYTTKAFAGTVFEKDVISFEQRKAMSYPSKRGLFVAEVLLLEYVSYGKYPGPKNGYPGFWWFEYGIRDVGAVLSDLEYKGFIEYAPLMDNLNGLTVTDLKAILEKYEIKATGKKADLIEAIKSNLTEEQLGEVISERKYRLTIVGEMELADNEYVPYMHKARSKTSEDGRFGPVYNVWSINKLLKGNTANWREVVDKEFQKQEAFLNRNN